MICRVLILFILFWPAHLFASGVIRINQLGYFPDARKVAVFLSDRHVFADRFQIIRSLSGEKVFEAVPEKANASVWEQQTAYRLDFSSFRESGGFYLQMDDAVSPSFRIASDIYEGTADFPLTYLLASLESEGRGRVVTTDKNTITDSREAHSDKYLLKKRYQPE